MDKTVRAKVAERLLAHKKETVEDNPEIADWFLIAVNGSYNYNLETPASDVDTKFLTIPSLDQLLYKSSTNYLHVMRDNGEHTEVKDIRSYVHTMLKQNINFVETLYAQVVYVNPKYKRYWDMMVDMRDAISSCNPIAAVKCMQGMAHQKRKDMVTETPGRAESIRLFGYDKKSFHHLVRLACFAGRYMRGDSYIDCLTNPDLPELKSFLKDIKRFDQPCDINVAIDIADFYLQNLDVTVEKYLNKVEPFAADFKKEENEIRDILREIITQVITKSLKESLNG